MKKLILIPLLVFFLMASYGQSSIGSVNSGAVSGSNLVFTVGEIFVLPDGNVNEANSGLMGVLSRVEFLVTGINDKIYSDDLRVYPNPSSQSVFFETIAANPVKEVFIYNNAGQLVLSSPVNGKVDISALKDGLYFIKTSINDTKSIKIIKQ